MRESSSHHSRAIGLPLPMTCLGAHPISASRRLARESCSGIPKDRVLLFELKMKILIFPSSYPPVLGGLQEAASRLAQEFKKKGHNVTVITQRYPKTLKKKEVVEDTPVYRILFPNLIPTNFKSTILLKYILGLLLVPFAFFRLLYLLRQEKPDFVHLHFVGTGALYLLACGAFIPFKMIVTLHGDDVEGLPFRYRFHKWLLAKTLKNADFVTACSNYLLQKAQTLYPAIEGKLIAIHNGVDLSYFEEEMPYKHVRHYIFAAGRFVHKKGFDILLKAYRSILDAGHDIDLILAGDGPERENLITLAAKLYIPFKFRKDNWSYEHAEHNKSCSYVHPYLLFWSVASRPEMASLLKGAELVVIPSRLEPFGIIALEAFAAGKMVVASRTGGLVEIVKHGVNGFLVDPEDPDQLAQHIVKLLRSKQDRVSMESNAIETASRFSWNKAAETYLSVFSLADDKIYRHTTNIVK